MKTQKLAAALWLCAASLWAMPAAQARDGINVHVPVPPLPGINVPAPPLPQVNIDVSPAPRHYAPPLPPRVYYRHYERDRYYDDDRRYYRHDRRYYRDRGYHRDRDYYDDRHDHHRH